MTHDPLDKRIDKMLAAIERRRGQAKPDTLESTIKMHLFTEREQERLQVLLALLSEKLKILPSGHWDISELSDQELEEMGLWSNLEQALEQENVESAARYRRYLSQGGLDTLIAQFMSIPEESIPEAGTTEVQMIRMGHVGLPHLIYPLSRIQFRYDKSHIKRALEGQGHLSGDIDTMQLWCDYFAAAVAS